MAAFDKVELAAPRSAKFLLASANDCTIAECCKQSSQGGPFDP
jgi:hypothetical protein